MEGSKAKALQILYTENENEDKFIFRKDLLSSLLLHEDIRDRKIVSIPICGTVGAGKSFILNYFLRYLRAQYAQHDSTNWLGKSDERLIGFEWYGDIEPVTQGVCIWSEVFFHDSPSGEKYAIVLIDTQGMLGSPFTVAKDLTILATSAMLSSTLIYNVYKTLSFTDLEHLRLFSHFLRDNGNSDNKAPFSKVLVLARDFETTKTIYGLKHGEEIENNPQFRSLSSLKDLFKNVLYFSMCYPKFKVEDSELFDGSTGMLRPDFVKLLEQLPRTILSPDNIESAKCSSASQFIDDFEQITKDVQRFVDHLTALKAIEEAKKLYLNNMKKSIETAKAEAATTSNSTPEPAKWSAYNWKPFSFFNRASGIVEKFYGAK